LIDLNHAKAFVSIPGFQLNGKQMLIRPEQINITTKNNGTTSGIVQQILFWGGYYTYDVLIDQQLIRVKTNQSLYKTGEIVQLSLAVSDLWYI
jgi:ABC-type Fe3+/spermidine/putrescine transport system ATPase subunit